MEFLYSVCVLIVVCDCTLYCPICTLCSAQCNARVSNNNYRRYCFAPVLCQSKITKVKDPEMITDKSKYMSCYEHIHEHAFSNHALA